MNNKIKKVQSFFDNDASRYLNERYHGTSCEHISYLTRKRIVIDFLKKLSGTVLDVGCGPAIFTKELVEMNFQIYSVDLSFNMLKKAKIISNSNKNLFWANSQIEELPFVDNVFDVIICIGVITYSKNTIKALREIARILKPGGTIIIQCSNSLAPTPYIVSLKDYFLFILRLRKNKLEFDLRRVSFKRFKSMLADLNVQVEQVSRYDYRLPFIEKFFPKTATRLMIFLQLHLEKSNMFGWFAEGYVLRASKNVEY
jgi:ubiquinone/menaquinone biosynthesis C-methylase UbiE